MAAKIFVLAFAAVIWQAQSQLANGPVYINPLRPPFAAEPVLPPCDFSQSQSGTGPVYVNPLRPFAAEPVTSPCDLPTPWNDLPEVSPFPMAFSHPLRPTGVFPSFRPMSSNPEITPLTDSNECLDSFAKTPQFPLLNRLRAGHFLGVLENDDSPFPRLLNRPWLPIHRFDDDEEADREILYTLETTNRFFNRPLLPQSFESEPCEDIQVSKPYQFLQPVNSFDFERRPGLLFEPPTMIDSSISSRFVTAARPQIGMFQSWERPSLEEDLIQSEIETSMPFRPPPTSFASRIGVDSLGFWNRPILEEIPEGLTSIPSFESSVPSFEYSPTSYSFHPTVFKPLNNPSQDSEGSTFLPVTKLGLTSLKPFVSIAEDVAPCESEYSVSPHQTFSTLWNRPNFSEIPGPVILRPEPSVKPLPFACEPKIGTFRSYPYPLLEEEVCATPEPFVPPTIAAPPVLSCLSSFQGIRKFLPNPPQQVIPDLETLTEESFLPTVSGSLGIDCYDSVQESQDFTPQYLTQSSAALKTTYKPFQVFKNPQVSLGSNPGPECDLYGNQNNLVSSIYKATPKISTLDFIPDPISATSCLKEPQYTFNPTNIQYPVPFENQFLLPQFGFQTETIQPFNYEPPVITYSNPMEDHNNLVPTCDVSVPYLNSIPLQMPGFNANNGFNTIIDPTPLTVYPVICPINVEPLRDFVPTSFGLNQVLSSLPPNIEIAESFNTRPCFESPSPVETSASIPFQPNLSSVSTSSTFVSCQSQPTPSTSTTKVTAEASASLIQPSFTSSVSSEASTSSIQATSEALTSVTSQQTSPSIILNQQNLPMQANVEVSTSVSQSGNVPIDTQTISEASILVSAEPTCSLSFVSTPCQSQSEPILPSICTISENPSSEQVQLSTSNVNINPVTVIPALTSCTSLGIDVPSISSISSQLNPICTSLNELSEFIISLIPLVEIADGTNSYSSNILEFPRIIDSTNYYSIINPASLTQSSVNVAEASSSISSLGQESSSSVITTETTIPVCTTNVNPEIQNTIPIEIYLPITVYPTVTEVPITSNIATGEIPTLYTTECTLNDISEVTSPVSEACSSASISSEIELPVTTLESNNEPVVIAETSATITQATPTSLDTTTITSSTSVEQTNTPSICATTVKSSSYPIMPMSSVELGPVILEIEIPSSIGSTIWTGLETMPYYTPVSSSTPTYEMFIPYGMPAQIICSFEPLSTSMPVMSIDSRTC